MSTALIYKPAKSAMQSGKKNTKEWVLSYYPQKAQKADFLMGWIGEGSTLNQLKLYFETKEQAIDYAIHKKLQFEVRDPHQATPKLKNYADNFIKYRSLS